MIQSMTGYGRGKTGKGAAKVIVLIKAVNGRFLEVKIRGFDIDPSDDKKIRDIISEKLVRGTIHVNLEIEGNGQSQSLTFNKDRFEAIEAIILNIQKDYGRHLDLGDIVNANDLFTHVDADSPGSNHLIKAVENACTEVIQMRKTEGEKLKNDFEDRISILEDVLNQVEKELPKEFQKREKRYKSRIAELLDGAAVDENRIAQEIAMLAEKADVTEETVRLRSHFQQFKSLLVEKGSAGKRLNFLLQEMGREINTIGSKSSSEHIVNHVITLKDEAEKMREQIQNIL
ncbi:MAG: YicC family protein [Candidatus Marinimicrobia bacterium]|nr:YicC family protein [Candidatus Neomarinimicrobiota bacterium]MBL7009784.1 YicC family protein [Candidatus Neomarinimicrobiota bacterium]MBL7029812.1 YicC family protein [Candidatus Neomarinimicrobiota bacterium]